MQIPPIRTLNIPTITRAASRLKCNGQLAKSQNNLIYLNIENAYIHKLFPLLQDENINIPDYFSAGSVGAHITVIYPEENKEISNEDLGQKHHFIIQDLATTKINQKIYYILLVGSPSLIKLRNKYGLSDLLCFRGYSVGLHITIGVSGFSK